VTSAHDAPAAHWGWQHCLHHVLLLSLSELVPSVCCCGHHQVDVQDTVGCGDSFAAAIVLGYTRGLDVNATLALANAVGAATAMGRGAGTNVASADTVMGILQLAADSSPARSDAKAALAVLSNALVDGSRARTAHAA
jgi:bifunctional ADP-heptose synthase (sugar kinase/adenylyltransferase)